MEFSSADFIVYCTFTLWICYLWHSMDVAQMLSKTDPLVCQSSGIPVGSLVQSVSVAILPGFWPIALHLAGMNPKHWSWRALCIMEIGSASGLSP